MERIREDITASKHVVPPTGPTENKVPFFSYLAFLSDYNRKYIVEASLLRNKF